MHGSREALESVLENAGNRGCGAVVCLGDIVGYGDEPVACVDRIRELAVRTVLGNHDVMALSDASLEGLPSAVAAPIQLARRELSEAQKAWLNGLPLIDEIEGIEICHASLHAPGRFVHQAGIADLQLHFGKQSAKISFFGHTHVPIVYHESPKGRIRMARGVGKILLSSPGRYAVGVGSVAFSRDEDERPCWVEFDPMEMSVCFHRLG